jgi:Asp-tRNA(Asn)/Glu-tRNA(Gln) amidotransferase A subunit family amidase
MVELLERGERVSNQKLGKAKQSIEQTRNHIESVMNKKDIDVVVTPPTPDVAPAGLDDDGDPVMNLPWAHAGVPALTLPVGSTNDGLPIGIGCVGRFGHDESLLSHAETVRAVLINTSR